MLRLALWFLAIFVPLQIVLGDMHGLNTLEHQPAKLAAIEGLWDGGRGVPASIIGWPDQTAERNLAEIAIPRVGSLYLTHSWDGEVKGLKDFPPDQRAPVAIVYFAFRIMVGIGLLMLAVVAAGFVLMARGRLDQTRWYLRLCQFTTCLGFIAVIAGWTTTEVGRQPWTIYGLMRTADLVSPSLTGSNVLISLLLYVAVYLVIYPVGLSLMLRFVWRGPVPIDEAAPIGGGRPKSADRSAGVSDTGERNMTPTLNLVPIWTTILAVGVFLYVALDGFDLGVGMLYNFAPDRRARDFVMNSIAPIWDGNETWLILGSVGLLAAFPVAFAIIIPAVYFPILLMLLALIFRGLAFEFRYRDAEHRTFWDHGFAAGSALAAFAQGVVLGAFIQGFQVEGRQFVGGSFDCFTPFSIFTGVALMFGYALLGAGWLIIKTEGDLQDWARALGRRCLIGVTLAVAIVSLWTPFIDAHIAARWFTWPNIAIARAGAADNGRPGLVRVAVAQRQIGIRSVPCRLGLVRHVLSRHRHQLVADDRAADILRFEQAAASQSTQAFLLIGTLVLLPVILLYTAWSYWVFRGKVRSDIGYH